jgi:hypothetical protein
MSIHPFDPAIPSRVWEQDVPVGGADVDGQLPGAALATVPVGVATVRNVPTLAHTSGRFALLEGGTAQRIGRVIQRRRLILSVSTSVAPDAYIVAGDTQQQAEGGFGLEIPAGAMLVLGTAGELWFAAVGDDLRLSWLQEMDQG